MNSRENTLEVLFYLFENYQEVDDVNDNKAALHTYFRLSTLTNPERMLSGYSLSMKHAG